VHLLIIEDDPGLRENLSIALTRDGYAVEAAATGEDGLFLGKEMDFDAAIIDLGLPGISGIEVIKQLRKYEKSWPILILTARDHWQDKVTGLSAGADDYVVKPFHIEEVLARLNALLRRSKGFHSPEIKSGNIVLHSHDQRVFLEGEELELTAFEYKVIEYLMLNPDKVVSKTELTEHIYAQDYERDSNVIEVFVGRLRKKLDPNGHTKPIETLRGRGYRWAHSIES